MHLILSYKARLYHHPVYNWGIPLRATWPYGLRLVVDRSSVRGFEADCPLLSVLRVSPYTIQLIFYTFVAFAFKHVSSLCCSLIGFRVFQQFNMFISDSLRCKGSLFKILLCFTRKWVCAVSCNRPVEVWAKLTIILLHYFATIIKNYLTLYFIM